jgi:hypothetical protein
MRAIRFKAIAYKPDEITMTLVDEDEQDFDLTLKAEMLPHLLHHLMFELKGAAQSHPQAAEGLRYDVHSIQAIVDETNGRKGFHILTDRALELVLTFDQKQLDRLNDGIFRLLSGDSDDPKVH